MADPLAPLSFLVVRSRGRVDLVRIEDVDWVETAANYVRIHAGSEVYRMRSTFAAVKSRLDPARFLPIHRCIIVNVERVKQIRPSLQGSWTVILRDGSQLNLSRSYRPVVERFLDDLAVGLPAGATRCHCKAADQAVTPSASKPSSKTTSRQSSKVAMPAF